MRALIRTAIQLRRVALDSLDAGAMARAWRGGSDTYEIAVLVGLPEATVYNTLHALREVERLKQSEVKNVDVEIA